MDSRNADIDAEVGALVHQAMFRARISQTRLAPLLGIGQSTLSKKLRGTIPWSVVDLVTAAQLLDVDVADLLKFPTAQAEANGTDSGVINACSSRTGWISPRHLHLVAERTTPASATRPVQDADSPEPVPITA